MCGPRRRWAAALCTILVLAPVASAQSGALDELAWLVGEWQRQTRSGTAIERWTRTGAGLVGEGVAQRGEQSMQTEALLLVEMVGELYYIAKPRENPYPVAFRLVSRADGAFVFENTDHDFPQRITYRRTAEESLTVVIEGPGDDGTPQRIAFEFTRR